uniref:Putative secreted protein n=1 Tax=Amblyomma cajennense TaxID=34607 RepID=A0A023FBU0_AMBCJ
MAWLLRSALLYTLRRGKSLHSSAIYIYIYKLRVVPVGVLSFLFYFPSQMYTPDAAGTFVPFRLRFLTVSVLRVSPVCCRCCFADVSLWKRGKMNGEDVDFSLCDLGVMCLHYV